MGYISLDNRGNQENFSHFSMETCCGYSMGAPWRGASNEYAQHMFSWRKKKNIKTVKFLL